MKRMVVSGCVMLSIVCTLASSSWADPIAEHRHGPRHGGQFGDAEDLFHFELVLEPSNRLLFYVNDALNRPLDVRTLQARWTLNPDAPSPLLGSFVPSPDGAYFSATLPPITTNQAHMEVAVLKGTQWVAMEFFLPVARPAPQTY